MSEIWGAMPRATNDATLIDEAISAAVTAHEADPDAHLGTGEALQSHRAAEVIDHLAESVVNDKIRANARTYLAIVDPAGDGDFTTIEDACDYAFQFGSGSIFIKKGNYTPTRDLKLKYGIDLYGEGPEETNVNLSSTENKTLNVSGNRDITVATISHIYYYTDQDAIDVWMPDNIDARALDFCYVVLPWWEGLLYESDNDHTIYVGAPAVEDGVIDDFEFIPTVEASTDSDIVHVNGWELIDGLAGNEGLWMYSDGTPLGIVKAYLGDGDVQLDANSINSAVHYVGVAFVGQTGRMSVIQGLSFNCAGSSYVFYVDGMKGRLYVRDGAFTNCAGLFKVDSYYNTMDAIGVTIEDTNLYMTGGACNFDCSGATLRNCNLYFDNSSYPYMLGGKGSYFENCNFIGGVGGTTNRLQSVQRESRFNGCVFRYMSNGNIVNNGSFSSVSPEAYVSFVGCSFIETLSWPVVFTGNNILVSGCRFYVGSANVGLNSSTRYSVFTGNQGYGTLLSQPTNCIVSGNGFWSSMS